MCLEFEHFLIGIKLKCTIFLLDKNGVKVRFTEKGTKIEEVTFCFLTLVMSKKEGDLVKVCGLLRIHI